MTYFSLCILDSGRYIYSTQSQKYRGRQEESDVSSEDDDDDDEFQESVRRAEFVFFFVTLIPLF